MKFTVIWKPAAEQELADIWVSVNDRAAVSAASNMIDALLARDPITRGQPKYDTVRELIESPLGVAFDVQEDDRLVFVIDVWHV